MPARESELTLVEAQKAEVLRMIRLTGMGTAEIFNFSHLIGTPEDVALVLHELEREGKVTVQDGLWCSLCKREPVKNLAQKCQLLERLSLMTSEDIAITLREIAGDLSHVS